MFQLGYQTSLMEGCIYDCSRNRNDISDIGMRLELLRIMFQTERYLFALLLYFH